jgi:hypothetical protein
MTQGQQQQQQQAVLADEAAVVVDEAVTAAVAEQDDNDEGQRVPSWLVMNDRTATSDGIMRLVDSSCHHLYRQERLEIDGSISPCCWLLSLPIHCGFCPYQTGECCSDLKD